MSDYTNMIEALQGAASRFPANGFTFQNQAGEETTYTFPEMERITRRIATGLQERGLIKGDRLGLIITEPEHFVLTFLAAVRVGIVPVPIYPPLYLGSLASYFRQTEAILRSSHAALVAVSTKLVDSLSCLLKQLPELKTLIAVESLRSSPDFMSECSIEPDDVVFLQYTSGSTMEPRGVMVTHRSLVSNIHCFMGQALRADPATDKGVTWLPLYHDMGLVGFVLGPLYWGVSVVFIPTLRFVKNTGVWMEAIHNHRGTITFAPNFAFALMLRRARAVDLERWDLSSLKALGCGAEPIQPDTMRQFMDVFGQNCGLPATALMPAYGLAECTLAVAMKRLPDIMHTDHVHRTAFEEAGVAQPPVDGNPVIEHVACGAPFDGHEVEIRDAEERPLPDGYQGEIWVRGPSVCAGYAGNPEAWSQVWRDGWLRTGDLGYRRNHQLFISGRSKDLIILNGRNVHPQLIEWVVNQVKGVRPDCIVAFSRPGQGGEELVVVVETKERRNAAFIVEVADAVQQAIYTKPADIVCVKPGSLPRTSSGKLRRQQVRRDYLSGSLTATMVEADAATTAIHAASSAHGS